MPVATIAVNIPAHCDQPFVFRRAFLSAIRSAVAQAHADGTIDSPTAVECNRALPPATAEKAA